MSYAAVVTYEIDPRAYADTHIKVARAELGRRLGAFNGGSFAGEYDPAVSYAGQLYFIPSDTLLGGTAAALGIISEQDLFGGVVPYPFVATKVLTHALVAPNAVAPTGWSQEFGSRVEGAVLAGFSVFSPEDARRAGVYLLEHGSVRTKPARATAGRDQTVIASLAELDGVLDAMNPIELSAHGLVIEENLTDVATYSVGQVRVAGSVATYYGTQRLTTDNHGEIVYGGSDLIIVRGDFEPLLRLGLPEQAQRAVSQARIYDAAAFDLSPGLFVSRLNYDVAEGCDARGHRRSGVLEQSWRMGGASAAEMAALEAFRDKPALNAVHASSFEAYGQTTPPPGAIVYYHGVDERIGSISRYATVEPYDHAR